MKIVFDIKEEDFIDVLTKPYTEEQITKYKEDLASDKTTPLPVRERISLLEGVGMVCRTSVALTYKVFNTQAMRQVLRINTNIEAAITDNTTNTIYLEEKDVQFLRKCISKAEWTNSSESLSKFIIKVEDCIALAANKKG